MSGAWLVERERDVFEQVKADVLEVASGSLVFFRSDGGFYVVVLAYAAGTWLTVCEDA